jgi:hypothetical protein
MTVWMIISIIVGLLVGLGTLFNGSDSINSKILVVISVLTGAAMIIQKIIDFEILQTAAKIGAGIIILLVALKIIVALFNEVN